MTAPRCAPFIALLVGLLGGPRPAHAAPLETTTTSTLREYPSSDAPSVGSIDARVAVRVVDRAEDGRWLLVRGSRFMQGWLPASKLRARRAPAPPRPERHERPDATVAERATIDAHEAVLYGRPDRESIVVNELRRGDGVSVHRRSADGGWAQVEDRDGSLGWVDARTLLIATAESERATLHPSEEAHRPEEPIERSPRPRDDHRDPAPSPPRAEPEQRRSDASIARANHVEATFQFGFAVVAERVRTNGTSPSLLANYEYRTTHLAIGGSLHYARAWDRLRIHVDARFVATFLGAVAFTQPGMSATTLKVLSENFGAGVALGGFFDAAGGVDLRLRIGVDAWFNQIEGSPAPLTFGADTVVGMTVGAVLGFPAIARIAGRPFGFRLAGGVVAPATRIQRTGLLTAPNESTKGGYVGVLLHYTPYRNARRGNLRLEVSYDGALSFSHFYGPCPPGTAPATRVCRDDTVSDASYNSAAHVGAIGLSYEY